MRMRVFMVMCVLVVAMISAGIEKHFKAVNSSSNSDQFFRSLVPRWVKDSLHLFGQNPPNEAQVLLGRYLFYDNRLSINGTKSCASCHNQQLAFTDGYRTSTGAFGDALKFNSAPLVNLVFNQQLTAADSTIHYPEEQFVKPFFNDHPPELGWQGHEPELINRLTGDSLYRSLFASAYPHNKSSITVRHTGWALASFVKSILSFNTPYDQYISTGAKTALNDEAMLGAKIFFSKELQCGSCHGGINFNFPRFQQSHFSTVCLSTGGGRKENKEGLNVRVPTLRNLAFTSPYFHDGSAATLPEVLERHNAFVFNNDGVRPVGRPYVLTQKERTALIQFLYSLSDSSITTNEKFSNPWADSVL